MDTIKTKPTFINKLEEGHSVSLPNVEVNFVYNDNEKSISIQFGHERFNYEVNKFEALLNKQRILNCEEKIFIFFSNDEYHTISSWFESIKQKEITRQKENRLLEIAFTNKFYGSDEYVFNELKKHIKDCWQQWIIGQIFAPIVIICQSSGFGKSRCLFEFANNNFTIFICVRNINESGYPIRSDLADSFMHSFESNKSIETFLMALVQAGLEFIDLIIPSEIDSNEKEIACKEFKRFQPWLTNDNPKVMIKGKDTSFKQRVFDLVESQNELLDINTLREILNNSKNIDFLTIAIDEANVITSNFVAERSYFRLLRSAISTLFMKTRIVFVMTSTNTSISDFILSEQQITNSQRRARSKTYPPFYKLVLCDQLKSKQYENDFEQANKNNKLYEYIKNSDPVDSIFCYGRPLWSSINEVNKTARPQDQENILNLAKKKLIRAKDWDDDSLNKSCASLAILAVRTNIINNIVIENRKLTSNLISGHMATLFNVDESCNVLSFRYISEPILAEASSYFMSTDHILNDILQHVYDLISKAEIVDTRLVGELVSEIIFLIAHDKAILKSDITPKYFSKHITVENFIVNLIGQNNYDDNIPNSKKKQMSNSILAFNSFIQKLDVLKQMDLIDHFIKRCSAGRFKAFFPKFDHFIPIIYQNNKIGMILVQVKNRVDLTSIGELEDIAKNMDFSIFKRDISSSFHTDIITNQNNCFKVLLSLGNDFKHVSFKYNTLIVSGIQSFKLNEETTKILKKMLDYTRNDMKQYKDKEVCRLVTIGSAREDFFS